MTVTAIWESYRWMLCFALAAAAFVFLLPYGMADAQTSPIIGNGICDPEVARYQGVSKRVIYCIQDSIIWGTAQYFDTVYLYLRPAIYAFLTLAVTLFGVMIISQSVENIRRDSMVFVVKFAVIVGILQNLPWLYISILDITEGLLSIVVQFGVSGGSGFIQCPFSLQYDDVWGRVDCMLDTLIGIGNKADGLQITGPTGLSRGILNFFVSSAPGSALGVILLVMGGYVVFTLVTAIARAMQVYILGFIGISFLMAISPLMIPLFIMKATKQYFDKWMTIMIAFILQPVILIAFINMAIIAMDIVLVRGDDSFMRTVAGDRVDNPDFNLNMFLEDEELFGTKRATIDTPDHLGLAEQCLKLTERVDGQQVIDVDIDIPGCDSIREAEGGGIELPFNEVDYAALAALRLSDSPPISGVDPALPPSEQGEQMRKIVTTSSLIVLLCAYVFMSMLTYIPNLAHDLAGGAFNTPNLYGGGPNDSGQLHAGELLFQRPLSQAASGVSTSIRQGINQGINNNSLSAAGGIATGAGIAAGIYGAVEGAGRYKYPAERAAEFVAEQKSGASSSPKSAQDARDHLTTVDGAIKDLEDAQLNGTLDAAGLAQLQQLHATRAELADALAGYDAKETAAKAQKEAAAKDKTDGEGTA